jgi:tetratricopeptide (TPR) repeat protein/DNA-binding CsgD family transcriptional regulator
LDKLTSTIDSLFNKLKYNDAAPFINAMEVLVEKTNDTYYPVLLDYYKGSYSCVNSNYKEGFRSLNEAQNNVKKLPNNDKKTTLDIRIRLALSGCFISCDMLSEAMIQLQKGIEENESFGDNNLQIKLENNLAALYSLMGKQDESTMIYKKMLQEPELFTRGFFYCNYNIANNFINKGEADSALYYLNRIQDDIETKQERLLVTKKYGDVYALKGDMTVSIDYFEKVIQDIGDDTLAYISNYASVKQTYAEILYRMGCENDALRETENALQINERSGNISRKANLLHLKSNILSSLGRNEEALSSLQEMLVFQDSANKIQNLHEVNQLMTKQEILSLEKEYKHREFVEQLKHSREKMGMFTIIIVLLGVVAIALLLWNRKRILLKNKQIQEESLKFELEARNRELASNVVSLMKKNEVFSEIISKLEHIKENAVKDETKEALTKVKKEIEKTIDGSFWDEFELRFKNVHSDFYDKLISQFPNLTSNELRLCAFLKMNLSTKDIASITGQNPRSIDKARERLRTKLGISNDKTVSLASFIQRI